MRNFQNYIEALELIAKLKEVDENEFQMFNEDELLALEFIRMLLKRELVKDLEAIR